MVVAHDQRLVVLGFEQLMVVLSPHVWLSLASSPLGRFALAEARAVRTSSSPTPRLLICVGFSSTRTPGSALPPTLTWPTPSICESFCSRIESAASYIKPGRTAVEVRPRIMIGASAGLTFR